MRVGYKKGWCKTGWVCMYVHICVFMCVMYVCMYMYYVFSYVCMCTSMHVYVCISLAVHLCVLCVCFMGMSYVSVDAHVCQKFTLEGTLESTLLG